METVLTAVVGRLLKKFIKGTSSSYTSTSSSDTHQGQGQGAGGAGAGAGGFSSNSSGGVGGQEELRVRLNKGRVQLHNLDLNLDTLFNTQKDEESIEGEGRRKGNGSGSGSGSGGISVSVARAFAKELSVHVPWLGLATVTGVGTTEDGGNVLTLCLDTVEIVLDVDIAAPTTGEQEEEDKGIGACSSRKASPPASTPTTPEGERDGEGVEDDQRDHSGEGGRDKAGRDRRTSWTRGKDDEDELPSTSSSSSSRSTTRSQGQGSDGEGTEAEAAASKESNDSQNKKGWLNSLLNTLGDTSVKVRNLVVKLRLPGETVTVMCGELRLFTSFEDDHGGGQMQEQNQGNGKEGARMNSKWMVASTIMLVVNETDVVNINDMKVHLLSPFSVHSSSVENLRDLDQQQMDPQVKVYFDEMAFNVNPALYSIIKLFEQLRRSASTSTSTSNCGEEETKKSEELNSDGKEEEEEKNGQAQEEEEEEEEEETVSDETQETRSIGEKKLQDSNPAGKKARKPEDASESTWFSLGSSIASKTWDFIIASEEDEGGEGNYIESSLSEEEKRLERELEIRMSTIWSKFSISVAVNKVKLNLSASGEAMKQAGKAIAVSLEGLTSGLCYDSGSIGDISAQASSLRIEHIEGFGSLSAQKPHGGLNTQLVLLCNSLDRRMSNKAETVKSALAVSFCNEEAEEEGNSKDISISVGESWLFYTGAFLRDAQVILGEMGDIMKQDDPVDSGNSSLGDKDADSLEDGSSQVVPRGMSVQLEVASATLSFGRDYPLLSQVGMLVENVTCGVNVKWNENAAFGEHVELNLSSMLYLVQLKKLSPEHYIRNYLSRAANVACHAKRSSSGGMNASLDLDELECCLEGNRFRDLAESTLGHDRDLRGEVLQTLVGLYSHVGDLRVKMASSSTKNTCIVSIDSMMFGLFFNPSASSGANALLMEVIGAELHPFQSEKELALTSVTGSICRDSSVSCNSLLRGIFSSSGIERNLVLHSLRTSFSMNSHVRANEILLQLSLVDLESVLDMLNFAQKTLLPEEEVEQQEGVFSVAVGKALVEIYDASEGSPDQSLSLAVGCICIENSLSFGFERSCPKKDSIFDATFASLAVTHSFEGKQSIVLHFERGFVPSSLDAECQDYCLKYLSNKASTDSWEESQMEIRTGTSFVCHVTKEMLTMVLDLLVRVYRSQPASFAEESREKEEGSADVSEGSHNSCVKVSLMSFDLYFDDFHHQPAGEKLLLSSEGLILTLYPSQESCRTRKSSEVDVCTLSFKISVVRASSDLGEKEFVFLGPADVHWKWQNLESFVLTIDAESLPLQLYWGVHWVIPSAFYGLFRVVYEGWQNLRAKAERVRQDVPKEKGKEEEEQLPFLIVVLQGSEMQLDIQSKCPFPIVQEDQNNVDGLRLGSVIKLMSRIFRLGFHFWSSSHYLFTFLGRCELRHEDGGAGEPFLREVPVKASLGFDYETSSRGPPVPTAKSLTLDSFSLPSLLKREHSREGVSLEICAEEKVHLALSSSIMQKVRDFGVGPLGMESVFVTNLTRLPVSIGQHNSDDLETVLGGGESHNLSLQCTSVLSPKVSRAIRVRVNLNGCQWGKAIDVTREGSVPVVLPVSEDYEVFLVANIARVKGKIDVVLRPRHSIVNATRADLDVTCEGCLSGCDLLEQQLNTISFNLPGVDNDGAERPSQRDVLILNRRDGEESSPKLTIGAKGKGQSKPAALFGSQSSLLILSGGEGVGSASDPTCKLFCEVLANHLDTGQILIRIHPSLYLANELSKELLISNGLGGEVKVPSSSTVPLFGFDLSSLSLSIQEQEEVFLSSSLDCRNHRTGWFEVILSPKAKKLSHPLRCLGFVESVHAGSLDLFRIVPEVSFQNFTDIGMKISFGSSHAMEEASAVAVSSDETVHAFPDSNHPSRVLSLSVRGAGSDGSGKEDISSHDLTDLPYGDQDGPKHVVSTLLSFQRASLRFVLRSARTLLPKQHSEGGHIFQMGIFPLFSVLNMCRRDVRVRCCKSNEEALCRKDSIAGLGRFCVTGREEDKGGAYTTRLRLGWGQKSEPESKRVACWSDEVEIRANAGFTMLDIPEEAPFGGRNVCISCHTFAYEGRYITLLSEEDFPPFLFENQTDTNFEIWMTNRERATIEDADPCDVFILSQGAVSKDLGIHFAHLCVANRRKRKSGERGSGVGEEEEDAKSTEVETILSLVNKAHTKNEITMFYRPVVEPKLAWSRKVLREEELKALDPDHEGHLVSSTYSAPTWYVTFGAPSAGRHLAEGEGGSEEGQAAARDGLRSVSVDVEELQVSLTDEQERGNRCQIGLNRLRLSLQQWKESSVGFEETLYEMDMAWAALQLGIQHPSRAVLWTSSSSRDREASFLKALLHVRPSLSSDEHRILYVEKVALGLSRMNVRIDDPVLSFITGIQRRYASSSSSTTSTSTTSRGSDQLPLTEKEALLEHVAGSFPILGLRIYIGSLLVHKVHVVCTFRSSGLAAIFPYTLDVFNSPIVLQAMCLEGIHTNERLLMHTVSAYYIAEGIANAPQIVGSLGLLFNPMGLVQSVKDGVFDLIHIPLEGLRQGGGPLTFVGGIGIGSLKLLGHVSGSLLSSLSNASSASSSILNHWGLLRPIGGALGVIGEATQSLLDASGFSELPPELD